MAFHLVFQASSTALGLFELFQLLLSVCLSLRLQFVCPWVVGDKVPCFAQGGVERWTVLALAVRCL